VVGPDAHGAAEPLALFHQGQEGLDEKVTLREELERRGEGGDIEEA
jgi:hypothetical protein